ncbi:MAG: lamin tail domain-containing protein [Candidatus Woesearchaeota archaeon]|nr:lamin tail domain-containing protein [Candidatus Woesearchaeota archaeon]
MKKYIKSLKEVVVCFILAIFFFLNNSFVLADILRVNEIMYNPDGDDNNKEFIEIYMDPIVNLSGYIVADSTSNDTLKLLQYIESNYALIVEEGFLFGGINASIYSAGATIGNNLDNTADSIFIYTPNKTLVASAHYNGSLANGNGYSMEFDAEKNLWSESIELGGTPGRENSIIKKDNYTDHINNSNDTTTEICNTDFFVITNKDLYNNSETAKIKFNITNNDIISFIIEYWVEDLFGNIVKSKYNTTNLNQKSWTPDIDEEDKTFYVKAILYYNCSGRQYVVYSQKMIVVLGTNYEKETTIDIEEVKETAKFGDILNIRVYVYKGSESKSSLSLWVEDRDSGEKLSETTKTLLYGKYKEYGLALPVQLKQSCSYNSGTYTLIVEGFNITKTRAVKIEKNSDCDEKSDNEETIKNASSKLSYEIVDYPDEVFTGENFSIKVNIQNDNKKHNFTLWSYVYKGAKCFSCINGDRDSNKRSITLEPYESETIELFNIADGPEDMYKLKVKIKKDYLKTEYEITKDILLFGKGSELNTSLINPQLAAYVEEIKIENIKNLSQSKNSSKNAKSIEGVTGGVVYKSATQKAKEMVLYLIIIALAVLILILARNLFKTKRPMQKL